jgi:hypothetical protein
MEDLVSSSSDTNISEDRMLYARLTDDNTAIAEYPYSIFQARNDNPKKSLPKNPTEAQLLGFHVAIVTEVVKPENTSEYTYTEDTPTWDGASWVQTWKSTSRTMIQRKSAMKAEITAKRWSVETSGITVSSVPVATDAQTQAKLSGALQLVQADDTVLIDWKGSDGTWSQLNASAVTTIAMAVGSHVQACFTREKELHTAVDNAVDSDALDLIDIEAGSVAGSGSWPN